MNEKHSNFNLNENKVVPNRRDSFLQWVNKRPGLSKAVAFGILVGTVFKLNITPEAQAQSAEPIFQAEQMSLEPQTDEKNKEVVTDYWEVLNGALDPQVFFRKYQDGTFPDDHAVIADQMIQSNPQRALDLFVFLNGAAAGEDFYRNLQYISDPKTKLKAIYYINQIPGKEHSLIDVKKQTAMNLAINNPEELLSTFYNCHQYIEKEIWANQVYQTAYQTIEQRKPWIFFQFIDDYIAKFGADQAKQTTKRILIKMNNEEPYNLELINGSADLRPMLLKYQWNDLIPMFEDLLNFVAEHPREKMVDFFSQTINKEDFPIEPRLLNAARSAVASDYIAQADQYQLISLSTENFNQIFFSETLQKVLQARAGTMTYMNAVSLAQAVYQKTQNQKFHGQEMSIEVATTEILERLDSVKGRQVYGPDVQVILVAGAEDSFNNIGTLNELYYGSGGKSENVLLYAKGFQEEDQEKNNEARFLEAIRNSKGPTTINISAHGYRTDFSFDEEHFLKYEDLAQALIDSNNINNITLIFDTCESYVFRKAIFMYLHQKDITDSDVAGLVIITSSNYGDSSYSLNQAERLTQFDSVFSKTLYNVTERNSPITVEDVLKVESQPELYLKENPSISSGTMELSFNMSRNEHEQKSVPV